MAGGWRGYAFPLSQKASRVPFSSKRYPAQKDTQLSVRAKDIVNLDPDRPGAPNCPPNFLSFPPGHTAGLHTQPPLKKAVAVWLHPGQWTVGTSDICHLQDWPTKPPAQPSTLPSPVCGLDGDVQGEDGRASSPWGPERLCGAQPPPVQLLMFMGQRNKLLLC